MENSIYEQILNGELSFKVEDSCPVATKDIAVNLKNRKTAIDSAMYGPLNPSEPNEDYWKNIAGEWDVDVASAKKQLCGNCVMFIVTPQMKDCINSGVTGGERPDEWAAIDSAGQLGYCEAFDFKCAAKRTCRAWVVGGPITEEKENQPEEKSAKGREESQISSWMNSMSDDEVDSLFPENEELTDEETKWMFGEDAEAFKKTLMKRRKAKGNYVSSDMGMEQKAAKKPVLRDPKGGLTAAGRKHFNRTEGSNLKPGVKGPADTPEKMRRKGSFLTRFFTNPRGPMKDEKGRPTRLALSAAAWGEPVPQTVEAAKKLAAKGQNLLARYRRYKEAGKGKKSLDAYDFSMKALGQPVAQQGGTVANRQGGTVGSQAGRSSSASSNYDPNARDADGDGTVQEGTDYARSSQDKNKNKTRTDGSTNKNNNVPTVPRTAPIAQPLEKGNIDLSKRKPVKLPDGSTATIRSMSGNVDGKEVLIPTIGPNGENWDPDTKEGARAAWDHYNKTGQHLGKFNTPEEADSYAEWLHNSEAVRIGEAKYDNSKTWNTNTGSADTRERGTIRQNLEDQGFDGEAFKKLMDAEARKLKPGQKTNWNPGRLPNGGKIAADGTYIPPDMVREDDKKASDYYRKRREARAKESRPKITREGDVVPNKNRDKATSRSGAGKTTREGDVVPNKNRDRRTSSTSSASSSRAGSADTQERRAEANKPKPGSRPSGMTGSPDSMERRIEAEERRRTGKGQGYDKLETEAEVNAYRESYGLPPIKSNKPNTRNSGSADTQERRAEEAKKRRNRFI